MDAHEIASSRSPSSLGFPTAVALTVVTVFLVWLSLKIGGSFTTKVFDDLGQVVVAAGVGVLCALAARKQHGRERRAWILLSCAMGSWALGEVIWSYYELLGARQVPFPSLADVGFLGLVPLAVAGMLTFRSDQVGSVSRLRMVLDGATTAGALLLISWSTALGATFRTAPVSSFEVAVGLAYPIADVIILVCVLILISHRHGASRRLLGLLAAGFAIFAMSDSAFAYFTATNTYATGALLDVGWVAGFALIGLAALHPYADETEERPVPSARPVLGTATFIRAALVTVAATIVIVTTALGAEDDFLIIAGALTLLLMIAQQMLSAVDRSRLQDRLIHEGLHDPLTSLPNRALFRDQLDRALARSKREGLSVALLFVDLDDFKAINDVMGHGAGDDLLCQVGCRFRAALRDGDVLARTGGDEFAVLLVGGETPQTIAEAGLRLLQSLCEPFVLPHRSISITASVGIALSTLQLESREQLLAHADMAMYAAKRAGKGTVRVFEPSMLARVQERTDLLEDLRRAVERDEFLLYYQPIISLQTRRVVGAEALLRWYHPTRGLLTPSAFLAVAEESGLILPIGWSALRQATIDAHRWRAPDDPTRPLFIDVNISARQLESPDFVQEVEQALGESGLDPQRLVLEVTETALVAERAMAAAKLAELRARGVRVAIDDFGTGYSSLSYLTQLPTDMIKIDRSFIQLLDTQTEDAQLVLAICRIARTLGFEVIGEGIETAKQFQRLRRMTCHYGQGYEIAPPLPRSGFESWLASGGELISAVPG